MEENQKSTSTGQTQGHRQRQPDPSEMKLWREALLTDFDKLKLNPSLADFALHLYCLGVRSD